VGRAGVPLEDIGDNHFRCPQDQSLYRQVSENELVAE
jgi:hypothetical protein